VREELPMPTQPPYTAHIGNLSFDATSEDVSDLFVDCEVTSVRIVEDKLTRTPKGFGYVEFGSVEGLKKALAFQGTQMKGRNIRVSVAEPRTFVGFFFVTSQVQAYILTDSPRNSQRQTRCSRDHRLDSQRPACRPPGPAAPCFGPLSAF
jgi:RNA recognition motif-containing protein